MNNIKITLPDNSIREYENGISAFEIAKNISGRLAKEAIVAEIDGRVKDLNTKIYKDSNLAIYTFDSPQGKHTYWHSTSHLMAHAIQELYPEAKFGVGPAIEAGFYYDIDINTQLTEDDLVKIEKKMLQLASQESFFVRQELTKSEALDFFTKKGDKYKIELIRELDEENEVISLYHEGDFTDLCTGPHVPSTNKIKYVKLLNISGSYWRGDEHRDQLQRIYGISFPKQKMLEEHLYMLEEAKKRDHRKLGKELELFMLSPKVGQGLPIWLPKGATIRETLVEFLKKEQVKRGYQPVITPHIGNIELYKTSGHYPYYKDSQFPPLKFEDSDEEYLLKPMNCPHHFQIYASKPRSYKDLPIRYAEYGTVYRYEQSGELNGITRVRGFTQDDSHLFVTNDQLKDEVKSVIELIKVVFSTFGFENFTTQLSFRDDNTEKYGGEISLWEKAQKEIQEAADEMGLEYKVELGEAAFYGPKIDFMVKDVLGRKWQLGTVQIDYVMPERFDLEYTGSDGEKHRPVVIHRAPFGSLERFIGILIEHYGGDFPTWLAPIQTVIIPISDKFSDYAENVYNNLKDKNIKVELDRRSEKVGYKIRDWENQKVPYMLIVGEKEMNANTVSVRKHKDGDQGQIALDEFINNILIEIKDKA